MLRGLKNLNLIRTMNTLPVLNLPVPTLQETCDTYLASVKPLATNNEFKRTCTYVSQFLDSNSYLIKNIHFKENNPSKLLIYLFPFIHLISTFNFF